MFLNHFLFENMKCDISFDFQGTKHYTTHFIDAFNCNMGTNKP